MENLINKRILVAKKKGYATNATVEEYKVLEISPSKRFIKLMDEYGKKFWTNQSDVTPIEILSELEKYPKD